MKIKTNGLSLKKEIKILHNISKRIKHEIKERSYTL